MNEEELANYNGNTNQITPEMLHEYVQTKVPGTSISETMEAIERAKQVNEIQSTGVKNSTGMALLDKVNAKEPLNKGEYIAMAIATILPVLAGAALGGKKGALAGIAAAGEGDATNLKVRENEARLESAKNLQTAKFEIDQDKEVRKTRQALEKEARDEIRRQESRGEKIEDSLTLARVKEREGLGPKGTVVEFKAPPEGAIINVLTKEDSLKRLAQAKRDIAALAKANYGGLDEMRRKSLAGKFADKTIYELSTYSPDSLEARLDSSLSLVKAQNIKSFIKGNSSERENADVEAGLNGKLSSLPQLYDILSREENNMLDSIRNTANLYNKVYKGPEGALFDVDKYRDVTTFLRGASTPVEVGIDDSNTDDSNTDEYTKFKKHFGLE